MSIFPQWILGRYAEPKRLVELGLAKAQTDSVGNRPRTLYTITPKGRRAFERWLDTPSAPSRFESETLLKVLFADYGTKDQLLATLERFVAEIEETRNSYEVSLTSMSTGAAHSPNALTSTPSSSTWSGNRPPHSNAGRTGRSSKSINGTTSPPRPTPPLRSRRSAPPSRKRPARSNSIGPSRGPSQHGSGA